MTEQKKTPNWMSYSPMLQLYKQAQTAEGDLDLDMNFLSDPHLGRYPESLFKGLELPENIWNFLNQVGLPDRFVDWRSPGEEMGDKNRDGYFGVIFSLRCLHIEKVNGREFFIIGENWSLGRYGINTSEQRSWWKEENCSYVAVEIKTGNVWQWTSFDEDLLTYINSSLEQYLLSMAYWRAFYSILVEKIKQFMNENPQKNELDYVFKHRKTLYAPFLQRMKSLDAEAMKKRNSYWKFMCDLSLY